MKFSIAGVLAAVATGIAVLSSAAQTTPPAVQQPATQPTAQKPTGQVIFSRSTDENGQTTTQVGPAASQPPIKIATAPSADDAERQAVTFTAFDMDVHLHTDEHHLAVRAVLTVRNDGKTPLARIPLQISSSLNWERIRINGKDAAFQVATLNSDADHTGQLHEAAVTPAQPLASGATLTLDVAYSGVITPSAQRLLAIGTPDDVALHSDWDQIGVPFTGLRGFGNVVWYPVSSVPVILGDGARLFDEMGEHKLRLTGAHFRLGLAVEFPHGQAPTIALINGRPVQLATTDAPAAGQEVAGVATAGTGATTLGFDAPSLFVAIRTLHAAKNMTLWTDPVNDASIDPALKNWTSAATAVTPFLENWLGQQPRSQLTLLDLPDPADAPFETGSLLATPIQDAASQPAPGHLETVLIHALTHAWLLNAAQPPRAWLSEGVANFMGTLWLEKQSGRDQALGTLEAARPALALDEPESPGQSAGQPLAQAISPVYYRTKATYVLWMLRDLAGDPSLSVALRAYDPDPAQDSANATAARPSFEKLLEKSSAQHDLSWFFAEWVDADKGLPDLTIESVFPTMETTGDWLVAVNIANTGYAQAEVPVTVRSALTSVTRRVIVPARGKAVQRILIQGKPTSVQVNDGTVPETQASVHVMSLDKSARDSSSSSSSNPPTPPQP